MKKLLLIVTLLGVSLNANANLTAEVVEASRKCTTSDNSKVLNCDYNFNDGLQINISEIGSEFATVTIFQSGYDGFYAKTTEKHSCVIVSNMEPEYNGKFGFISPYNGSVYSNYQACEEVKISGVKSGVNSKPTNDSGVNSKPTNDTGYVTIRDWRYNTRLQDGYSTADTVSKSGNVLFQSLCDGSIEVMGFMKLGIFNADSDYTINMRVDGGKPYTLAFMAVSDNMVMIPSLSLPEELAIGLIVGESLEALITDKSGNKEWETFSLLGSTKAIARASRVCDAAKAN